MTVSDVRVPNALFNRTTILVNESFAFIHGLNVDCCVVKNVNKGPREIIRLETQYAPVASVYLASGHAVKRNVGVAVAA